MFPWINRDKNLKCTLIFSKPVGVGGALQCGDDYFLVTEGALKYECLCNIGVTESVRHIITHNQIYHQIHYINHVSVGHVNMGCDTVSTTTT